MGKNEKLFNVFEQVVVINIAIRSHVIQSLDEYFLAQVRHSGKVARFRQLHHFLGKFHRLTRLPQLLQRDLQRWNASADQFWEHILGGERKKVVQIERLMKETAVKVVEEGFEAGKIAIGDVDSIRLRFRAVGGEHSFKDFHSGRQNDLVSLDLALGKYEGAISAGFSGE